MKPKLTVITGPKNSGKTLKASEISSNYDIDKVFWTTQPEEYISRVLDYWHDIESRSPSIVLIDDIFDEIFLYNMMLLYKLNKLAKKGISMVLICDRNIKGIKWERNAYDHNIYADFINISEIK